MLKRKIKCISPVTRSVIGIFFFFIIHQSVAQQPRTENNPNFSASTDFNHQIFPSDTVSWIVQNESAMRAGLLFDCDNQKIVWEKDLNYAYPIASLTKMMVALLVVEDVNDCKVDWNDEIVMTRQLVKKVKRRRVKYTFSETYTLDALFRLAMIASHNEACNTIARRLNGTVDNFVSRMNSRARELSMNNTYFSTPSGLPSGKRNLDNSSSPSDLLLLSLEMIKYHEILNITKIGYADISSDKASGIYRNHNHLVIDYENEVDGLKTGYTKNARFCLVTTSSKANHRLISIVLGARNPYQRNEIVADMLSNYYERIGAGRLTGNISPRKNETEADSLLISSDSSVTYKTVWVRIKKIHTVKYGETLSAISDKYNCSVSSIKKWNRLRTTRLLKGQKLFVYANVKKKVAVREDQIQKDDSGEEVPDGNNSSSEIAQQNIIYHTVEPGDTLWKISLKYPPVTIEQLKKMNNITNSKNLKPGTKLKIKYSS